MISGAVLVNSQTVSGMCCLILFQSAFCCSWMALSCRELWCICESHMHKSVGVAHSLLRTSLPSQPEFSSPPAATVKHSSTLLKGLVALANHLERSHNGFKMGSVGGHLMCEGTAQLTQQGIKALHSLFVSFEGINILSEPVLTQLQSTPINS